MYPQELASPSCVCGATKFCQVWPTQNPDEIWSTGPSFLVMPIYYPAASTGPAQKGSCGIHRWSYFLILPVSTALPLLKKASHLLVLLQ